MANCVVIKSSSTTTTTTSTTTTTTATDNKKNITKSSILNKTINNSNLNDDSIEFNFKENVGLDDLVKNYFDSFKHKLDKKLNENHFNKSTKLSKENMQNHSIDEKILNENLICLLTNELINSNLTKFNSDKNLTENLLKNLKKIKQLNKLSFCDLESNDSHFENLNKSFSFDYDQSSCLKNLDNFLFKSDFKCCADEKLKLRKDLQKYSKNTLMFVGLQRVALDLMGIKQWRKVFSEINCLEINDNETEDWKPNEICLLCDSNQNLNLDKLNTFKNYNFLLNSTEMTKNKPIMTTILTNNNSIIKDSESKHLNSTNLKTLISNMADQNENLDETETKKETSKHSTDCQLKSLTSLYENKTQCSSIVGDESASADFDNSSIKSETLSNESNALSIQNQGNMTIGDQKFQLTSLANLLTSKTFNFNSSQEDNKASINFDSDNQMNVSQFEQPLDLSLPSRKNTDLTNSNSVLSSVYSNEASLSGKLKKPKIEGSKKRSYTEEELEKALEDIQSGKLGTRRAAAIYKIPRSTLRNKVHKLNNADKNLKISSNQSYLDKKQSNSSLKMLVNLTPKNNLNIKDKIDLNNQEIQQSTSELLTTNDSLRELLKKNKNPKTIDSSTSNKNYANLEFLQNLQQRFELQQVLNNFTAQAQTYNQFNNLMNSGLTNENPAMRFMNQQPNLDNLGMNYNNSTLSNLIAFLNLHLQLLKHQEINKQNGDNVEDQMYSENELQTNSLLGISNENQNTDNETNLNNINLLNESINSVVSSNSYNSSALEMDFQEDESRSSIEKINKNLSKTNTDIEKVIETLQGNNTEDSNTQSSTLEEKPKLDNENINKIQQNNMPVNLNLNESFNSNNSLNLVNNSFLLNTLTNSFNTISNLANPLNLNQLNLASLTNNLGGFNNLSIGSLSSQCANQNVDSILNNTLNKNGQTKSLVEDLDLSFLPMNLQNINSDASTNSFLNNTANMNDFNSNSSNQNSALVDPNRKRPKRGRYRNYNKSDLDRAVKAVQKGEMSVHRAGTLYGVPHSTLEYKVKERHLLRPKKRLQKLQNTIESNTNLDEDPLNKSANFKQANSSSFSENESNINAAATLKNALRGKFKPFDQQYDNSIKMTSLNSLLQQPYVPTSSNKNITKQKNLDNQNFLNSSVDVSNSDLIKKLQKNVKEEDYSNQFF